MIEDEKISRVVDFKIPLTYLISGLVGLVWVLISMWFSVQQMQVTLSAVQTDVKSGNTAISVFASDLAMLKFRIDAIEDKLKGARQ